MEDLRYIEVKPSATIISTSAFKEDRFTSKEVGGKKKRSKKRISCTYQSIILSYEQ